MFDATTNRGAEAVPLSGSGGFTSDRIEAVCSCKTIFVRFDLNDYSIPPETVGRPLTLSQRIPRGASSSVQRKSLIHAPMIAVN
jgi:hypothetical protein